MKNKVKCESCGRTVALFPGDVHTDDHTVEGTRVTWYECPKCGSVVLAQIDNEKSIKIKDELIRLEILRTKLAKRGMNLRPKQKAKVSKLNRQLEDIRTVLEEKYGDEAYRQLMSDITDRDGNTEEGING